MEIDTALCQYMVVSLGETWAGRGDEGTGQKGWQGCLREGRGRERGGKGASRDVHPGFPSSAYRVAAGVTERAKG